MDRLLALSVQIICFFHELTMPTEAAMSGSDSAETVLVVYGDSGYFLSPNYPQKYPKTQNLTYTAYFTTAGPLILRMHFVLDLQKNGQGCEDADYIKLLGKKACGSGTADQDFVITGTSFHMIFYSDDRTEWSGFNVSFHVLEALSTVKTSPLSEFLTDPTTAGSRSSTDMAVGDNMANTLPMTTENHGTASSYGRSSNFSNLASEIEQTSTQEPQDLNGDVSTIPYDASIPNKMVTIVIDFSTEEADTSNKAIGALTETTPVDLRTTVRSDLPCNSTSQYGATPASRPPQICRCLHSKGKRNGTVQISPQQERDMAELIKTLTLNKKNMHATVRRYTSAPDDRQSAMAMGVLGIVVCILPLILMLITDIQRAYATRQDSVRGLRRCERLSKIIINTTTKP